MENEGLINASVEDILAQRERLANDYRCDTIGASSSILFQEDIINGIEPTESIAYYDNKKNVEKFFAREPNISHDSRSLAVESSFLSDVEEEINSELFPELDIKALMEY